MEDFTFALQKSLKDVIIYCILGWGYEDNSLTKL